MQHDDIAVLDELVRLRIERSQLEKREKEIIKRVRELQPALKSYFDTNPIQAVTINGYNVKLDRTIWAVSKTGNKEEDCTALKRAGLGQFVSETYNSNTLSAYVRDLEEHVEPGNTVELPPELAEYFEVKEVFEVRAKKATRAKRSRSAVATEIEDSEIEEENPWNESQISSLTEPQI